MKRETTNRLVLAIISVVILVAAGAAALLSRPVGNELYESIAMAPTAQTEQGIESDSSFTLTSDFRIKQEQLSDLLQVEPHLDYTVEGSGKSWVITPSEPLKTNMVYTFRILNEKQEIMQSFAFQTKSDLLVNSSYPQDESTYVDTNTGIEFTFNTIDVEIADYFEILPAVAGTFEVSDYTTTFIPSAPLTENSIYRVKLKAGLPAPNGTTLQEDYTFSFETTSAGQDKWDYTRLRTEEFSETFLPGDPLVVELSSGSDVDGVEFDVKMHQFPDVQAYIQELSKREEFYAQRYGVRSDYQVDTTGLEEVVSYQGELLHQGDRGWGSYYAVLPDDLQEGYYVVTITGEDSEGYPQFVQKLMQIRNLAVYTQSVNGDTLVWVNDPSSGGALSGLTLTLTDPKTGEKLEATTQDDGTARLLTEEMQSAQLQILRDGSPTYVEELQLSEEKETPLNEQFYTALYTDREVYRPDDTIHFWGVVKPRHMTNSLPTSVYAQLNSWTSDFYKIKVDVNEDGTFSGELPYNGVNKSWYSLDITDGTEGMYTSNSFEICDYTKPAYFIDVKTKKDVYYYNETIEMEVSATFYDGTPVAGANLQIDCYAMDFGSSGSNAQIKLDAAGKATVRGMMNTAKMRDSNGMMGWKPQTISYWVSSADPEDVQINSYGTFYALPSKTAAQVSADKESKTLTVRTAQMDASKVEDGNSIQPRMPTGQTEFDRLKGAPVNLPVSVLVHKSEFVQIPIGSYYDPVNKRTVQRYRGEFQKSVVKVLNGYTSNGTVVFDDVPCENEKGLYYWYEAQFSGGIVGHVSAIGYPGRVFSNEINEPNTYSFVDNTVQTDPSVIDFTDSGRRNAFALDEPITLGLYKNNTKVENVGSMLCTTVQSKMLSNVITREDQLELTMTEDYLPNVVFTGAYFDGRHIYKIENYNVSYQYDSKLLNVQTRTEQDRYRPGDTATVSLSVTEKATGKPTAASVCIGVVDEAVFDIAPQELDIAQQIYQQVFYPMISRSVSYKEYDLEKAELATGGRGGGGGDGDQIREDFVDTALFQTVTVDESGKAEVELPLPDNVTSWRITAVAVTPDLKAGNSVSNTIATLPFYLRPLYTNSYLDGDDVAISVGSVGTAVKPEDTVNYTVTIFDANNAQIDQLTASGKAGERTSVNFGKYEVGSYSMLIDGRFGDHHDMVKLPFSVVKHAMTVSQIDTVPLKEVRTLSSVRYPVTMTIYDERMTAFMDGLHRLSEQSGSRTEVLAAVYRAQVLYNDLLPQDEQINVRKDARLDSIQDVDGEGGVKLLPLGEGNAELTAKMLIAAPQLISQQAAAQYLQGVLADAASTPNDRVMAYVGLAAAKSPVLLDMTRMLKEDTTLTTAQKLYLGCGLAKLGDFTSAEQVYAEIKEAGDVKTETNLRYVIGATNDEQLQNTAAALMLTSITSNPDADALMRYLNAQNNERSVSFTTLTNLEMLTYLEHFSIPYGEKAGKFSYTLDGETTEEVLDGRGVKTLSLNAQAFQNVQFKSLSGNLSAAVNHTVYTDEMEVAPTNKLTITKSYTPTEEFQVSGKVRVDLTVTFSEDAPSGCYLITDQIPSGMRYLPVEGKFNPWLKWCWSTMEQDGQTVRGYLYRDQSQRPKPIANVSSEGGYEVDEPFNGYENEDPNVYTFTYFVSCMLPGEFVSESAYITPYEAGIAAKSERTTITINPYA